MASLELHSEAVDEAQRALDLAVQLGDPFAEAFAQLALGHVAAREGDEDQWIARFRRAQEVHLAAAPGWITRQCTIFSWRCAGLRRRDR
jgi:hypothetical protein